MTTETHTQTYTCPKCGKVHAADLSAMEKHPELHGKVHCMKCHALLWLSMGEDGQAQCELFEEHLHDVEAAKAKKQLEPSSPTAGTQRTSGFLPVLIAALVAAGVSFFVARAADERPGASKDGPAAADTTQLEQRIDDLTTRLDEAVRDASAAGAAGAELRDALAALQAAVEQNAEGLKQAPADSSEQLAAIQARLEKLAGDYKSLNGRIEGNYNALRLIKKRLDSSSGE